MITHRWRVFSRRSRLSWYTRRTTRPERRPGGPSTRTSRCSTIVSVCTRRWATAARRSTRRNWVKNELGAPTPRREVHAPSQDPPRQRHRRLLAIQDQALPLPGGSIGQVDRRQLIGQRQAHQLEGIILLGLPLHVPPAPAFGIAVGDLQRDLQT